jgi:Transposase
VCDAVEYVVRWGLEHRTLESIRAIGVDEIQYAKGHKYLTLVYRIDAGMTRLLWVVPSESEIVCAAVSPMLSSVIFPRAT